MSTAVVLSHRAVAHELGPLGDWLTARGFAIERIHREDEPELPSSADLLVVLGSPGSVAAGFCSPAGSREVDQVRAWVESDRPYLGICYGSQALALALGGSVERMRSTDRGWMTLASEEAEHDVFAGPWMVWHEDALTAPAHARVLARSGNADQVFAHRRAWGIQFHPELDSTALERMATALGAARADYEPLVTAMRHDEDGHRARAMRLFDAFWDDVAQKG
jgi:GMP synthase-like glutamine amidotransferase